MAEAALLLAGLALVWATISDLLWCRIPDGASLCVALSAVVFGLFSPEFPWLDHVAGAAVMFVLGLAAFGMSWLGGGDVKLLVALAAWTGLDDLMLTLAVVAIAGGLSTLVILPLQNLVRVVRRLPSRPARVAAVPYGPAIAIGAVWWASGAGLL